MFDIEYTVRRIGPHKFQVAKFGDRKEPLAVHDVVVRGDWGKCNCPAGYRSGANDKHVAMVRKWMERGEPVLTYYKEGDI